MKHIPIEYRMVWWSNQSMTYDKGGSFNLDLYIRILSIKSERNYV
jgi:hypothetical protein